MNKPKELYGKVEKFEDWAKKNFKFNNLMELGEYELLNTAYTLVNFYTQKFTPDMIEEYFEKLGFNWSSYFTDMRQSEFRLSKEDSNWDVEERQALFVPPPQTLSDFISACINSEIKLTWR